MTRETIEIERQIQNTSALLPALKVELVVQIKSGHERVSITANGWQLCRNTSHLDALSLWYAFVAGVRATFHSLQMEVA